MKLILYCLFIFSYFPALAQNEKDIHAESKFGINISMIAGTNLNEATGTLFTTSATLNLNRHKFTAGPTWWKDPFKNADYFRGGCLLYQYYPLDKGRYINFYFAADLLYSFERQEWSRYMMYNSYYNYHVDYTSLSQSLKMLGGYGFDLKIYRGLYFNNTISLGFEFYHYQDETTVKEAPELSTSYSSGNILNNSRPCGIVKLGIGYRFN